MLVDLCMFHFVKSMQMNINKMDSKISLLNPDETKNMTLDQAWALYSAGHPSFLTHTQMKRLFEYFLDSRISKETLAVFVESMSDETNPRIISKEAYDNFVKEGNN